MPTIDVPTPTITLLPFNLGSTADNYTAVPAGMVLALAAPADAAILPSSTTTFTVGIHNYDDRAYTIEVQYADNTNFTNATLITAPVDTSISGADFKSVGPLPSVGYWRSRLWLGTQIALDWSDYQSFSVAATFAAIKMPVSWTVNASATRPVHVWHIDPPSADVGSLITIYGQGFPTTGTVTCMGGTVAQTSWTRVPDSGASSGRQINASINDPEHYEVVVTVPDVEEPGGPLVVGS